MELKFREEVGVGAMVIVGLVVFTAGMFWLTGRSIVNKGVTVDVVFKSVAGLKEGDPVRVSGVKKGRVDQVRLVSVGKVMVRLLLDPAVGPHLGATATVASADFLGAKFVDYNPGAPDGPPLAAGNPIVGVTEAQFADIAGQAASSANELITSVNRGLNPGQLAADIHATLIATERGMRALTEATSGPLLAQTTQTLKATQTLMARLDTLLGTGGAVQGGHRLDSLTTNLNQLTDHLSAATKSLNDLLTSMTKGEGTLGRIATDSTLYRNLNATLASLSALLTDLKERPGRYLTVKVF